MSDGRNPYERGTCAHDLWELAEAGDRLAAAVSAEGRRLLGRLLRLVGR